MMKRIPTLLGAFLALLVTHVPMALAQPVITSPQANQVFRAGPDYATDVLQDPWDFDNVEDVGLYPYEYNGWAESANAFSVGPQAFGVGSGKFAATSISNDPAIGLLYPGFFGLPNPSRSGQRFPIQTATYNKLAFRLKLTGGAGAHAAVHWYHNLVGAPGSPGTAVAPVALVDGDGIYQIDLVGNHSGPAFNAVANALGLRLDPIDVANQARVELDWVRLTVNDGNPDYRMNVSANNCSGAPRVEVWDGTAWLAVASSLSFNYGILPPGNYQVRVVCGNGASAGVPFVINDPPRITVLQPDARGGADFATTTRGNPWDMDDAADVINATNIDQGAFVPSPVGGAMLRGRNVASPNTSIMGDPSFFLLYNEGAGRPIASTRYRYLTFTTQLYAPFTLDGINGSVARVGWASALNFDGFTASGTSDILVFPGRNTYTIDLGALTFGNGLEQCGPGAPCLSWAQRSPHFFRFDPHEFGNQQVVFDVDNVTLAAPDEVVQGSAFRIQWATAGAGAGQVNLYYDTDRNPSSGLQPIVGGLGLGTTFYDWNVGSLAPGDYYIYVQVAENIAGFTDVRGAYSSGVLHVIAAANNPVLTLGPMVSGGSVNLPITLGGCAFNAANGAPADDVIVYAHPLQGQMSGVVQILGYNAPGGLGTMSTVSCGPGAGYQVSNIFGLQQGLWKFRVLARNTITGDFDEVVADNVSIDGGPPPPQMISPVISGNTVTLAWNPPPVPITQYRVEAAADPSFAGFSYAWLAGNVTSVTATLGNGTYYIRVISRNDTPYESRPSNVVNFTLPGGGAVSPPGPVTLSGQLNANPISLAWSQNGGGPAQYVLHAGTRSGASDLAIVPMGGSTSLPPVTLPPGTTIYARVVASNDAGSTTSNEVVVSVPAPGPPGGPPIQLDPIVSGTTATIRWNAPVGGSLPTSYVIVARAPGSSAIIAAATGLTGLSLTVPGVPPGNYVLTIVAVYGSTPSAESNPKTLVVR